MRPILYFGLRQKYSRRYLWLDLQALATSLLRSDQALEQVRYFTARIRNDAEAEQRQSNYLDAVSARGPLVKIQDGRFQEKSRRCRTLFPTKRIVAAFPPGRHSADLRRAVDGFMFIGQDKIRHAQLPMRSSPRLVLP